MIKGLGDYIIEVGYKANHFTEDVEIENGALVTNSYLRGNIKVKSGSILDGVHIEGDCVIDNCTMINIQLEIEGNINIKNSILYNSALGLNGDCNNANIDCSIMVEGFDSFNHVLIENGKIINGNYEVSRDNFLILED